MAEQAPSARRRCASLLKGSVSKKGIPKRMSDDNLQGVYYNPNDYAGFLRRIAIVMIDISVISGIWLLITYLSWHVIPDDKSFLQVSFFSPFLLAYLYLVLVKRSIGTLGYLITGVRIVDLYGNQPSIVRMTGRFLWLFFVPLSFALDLVWLIGEESRQTLRDKVIGTYVVKKKTEPIGTGQQTIKIMSLIGLCLRLREVKKQSHESQSE